MDVLFVSGFLCLLNLVFASSNTVDQPPYFVETPPKLVIFKNNDSVELRYSTAGNVPSAFKWKKDGVNLDLKAPNIRQDAGTIRISPATQLDEGFYQCVAENKYGVTVSNVSQLQRAVLQPVGPTQLTNQLEAVEGQSFVIRASTFKVNPRPSSAEQYVWMKYAADLDESPQRIVPDKRIQIAQNGDLHFAYVNSSDDLSGKLYVDAVSNPFLNLTIEGNYTKLIVKSNPNGVQPFAPALSFSSVSKSPALEEESVTMRCFFSGKEEPVITWLLEDKSQDLGRTTISEDKTELTIINLTASDERTYYCMATNSLGPETHEISLKIEASPRFVKQDDSPQHTRVLEKDNAVFRCNAYAKPEADIVWFYNGQSLSENPRKRFAISADRKTLTISSVCLECNDASGVNVSDSGVIQCNASNVHGYALGTGYLNVMSMQSGRVIGSGAAHENSIPFEVAFIIILSITMLISF